MQDVGMKFRVCVCVFEGSMGCFVLGVSTLLS